MKAMTDDEMFDYVEMLPVTPNSLINSMYKRTNNQRRISRNGIMEPINSETPAALGKPPGRQLRHRRSEMHQDSTPDIPYGFCHCGCGNRTAISTYTDRGRNRFKGKPLRYLPCHTAKGFMPNDYRINGDDAFIALVLVDKSIVETVIDRVDLERVIAAGRWCRTFNGDGQYYARLGRGSSLHRFILNAPPHLEGDHIDNDGMNNRRSNLRLATRIQNGQNHRITSANTSGYVGVTWTKKYGCWTANIRHDSKQFYLGRSDNPVETALLYDEAARRLHGEFARLNFPGPGERGVR